MLEAVNTGLPSSPSLVLSRRKAMRRLRRSSFRVILAFTRNSLFGSLIEFGHFIRRRRKARSFEFFRYSRRAELRAFACSRPRLVLVPFPVHEFGVCSLVPRLCLGTHCIRGSASREPRSHLYPRRS